MPKVSVIIPVYKAENYLRKCVESVLAQTFADFECVLIDDKSPDSSGLICDEFALRDNRVRVIHNETNQGASIARKTGLNAAKGKYIQFADSDDWLEPTMVEKLYNKAIETNADMVYCDYIEERNDKQILRKLEEVDKIAMIRQILKGGFPLYMLFWNKLVKKRIYNQAAFPYDLNGHEDNYIMTQIFFFSQKIHHIDGALYHYNRQNEQSMTYSANLRNHLDYFNNIRYIADFLFSRFGSDFEKLFEPYFSYRVNQSIHNLLKAGFSDLKALRAFYPQANRYILSNTNMKFKHKVYLLFALRFGSTLCYKLFCATSIKKNAK
jgi:glycosyltransferase involved in cell wall biosynthesis